MCTSNRSQACLLSRAMSKRTLHPGGTMCLFLSHTLMTRPAACASRRRGVGRSRRMALASVVFYGAGKTHICPVYLWVLFDSHEAITTLSPGGLLFGGRMAAPPGRHRPGHSRAEVFYAIHDAAGCWATTQRGYHCCRSGCQDMLRRHVVAPGVLSLCMHFPTSFLVNTSGRAQGCCCGGVLRGQRGHRCCRS